jgi:hypothetical protein
MEFFSGHLLFKKQAHNIQFFFGYVAKNSQKQKKLPEGSSL